MYTQARYLIFFYQIIKTITQLQVSRFVFNYAEEKHDGNGEFTPAGMILIFVVSVAQKSTFYSSLYRGSLSISFIPKLLAFDAFTSRIYPRKLVISLTWCVSANIFWRKHAAYIVLDESARQRDEKWDAVATFESDAVFRRDFQQLIDEVIREQEWMKCCTNLNEESYCSLFLAINRFFS